MAWKSLFQPEAGSQTSILISESLRRRQGRHDAAEFRQTFEGRRIDWEPPGAWQAA